MKKIDTLSKTVVFITGAFVGNNCWDEWKTLFEDNGYHTLAPPWPHKDDTPEELRNRDSEAVPASIDLYELAERFAAIIGSMPGKPILIGHSAGGLIVQLLLQWGLGSAGVVIHSFPPRNVRRLSLPFIKEWWEAIGIFSSVRNAYLIPFRKWRKSFTNGISGEQQKHLYYNHAVPESRLLIRDILLRPPKIYYESLHVPLLFTSGSQDRISPPFRHYRKYIAGHPLIDHKEFKGMNHLLFGHPGWVEEAEYILAWLQSRKP